MKKNEIRLARTLENLVEEYIESNEPVASKLLVDRYMPDVSPATVRIDMFKLEQQNLIYQPHTSAGRIPTIKGYREYLRGIQSQVEQVRYERRDWLREMLIQSYRDTPHALHLVLQSLAKESDQLCFVAEPEISTGFLSKLEVFRIGKKKLLFVVSLDSGLDKTVIMNCQNDISEVQLKKLVRYINDELTGLRMYDIANHYLNEMTTRAEDSGLLSLFLQELHNAIHEISDFFVHFDGNMTFLEQPEFDEKEKIMQFLHLMQRHDLLIQVMQQNDKHQEYQVLLGEDFGNPQWADFALIYARYEVYDIPGYLGIFAPVRTNYRKLIPLVRDVAKTIMETTQKGMMVPNHEKKRI